MELLSFLGLKKVEAVPLDTGRRTEARRAGALRTFVAVKA